MAAELVSSATSEKLADVDWAKNIEICELAARDERQAKDVIKAIKKRLGSKNPNTQLYAVQVGCGPDLSYTVESCFMRMSYF
jgi:hypothetical protein